jgi:hypothetical protein
MFVCTDEFGAKRMYRLFTVFTNRGGGDSASATLAQTCVMCLRLHFHMPIETSEEGVTLDIDTASEQI